MKGLRFVFLVPAIGMLVSGYLALSVAAVPVSLSANEAATVVGGACNGIGDPVSICSGLFCWEWKGWKNSNSGNAVKGSGTYGTGTLQCPCDPSSNVSVASGTCTPPKT